MGLSRAPYNYGKSKFSWRDTRSVCRGSKFFARVTTSDDSQRVQIKGLQGFQPNSVIPFPFVPSWNTRKPWNTNRKMDRRVWFVRDPLPIPSYPDSRSPFTGHFPFVKGWQALAYVTWHGLSKAPSVTVHRSNRLEARNRPPPPPFCGTGGSKIGPRRGPRGEAARLSPNRRSSWDTQSATLGRDSQ